MHMSRTRTSDIISGQPPSTPHEDSSSCFQRTLLCSPGGITRQDEDLFMVLFNSPFHNLHDSWNHYLMPVLSANFKHHKGKGSSIWFTNKSPAPREVPRLESEIRSVGMETFIPEGLSTSRFPGRCFCH